MISIRYWIHMLVELKHCPFSLQFRNRRFRRFVHDLKSKIIEFCIGVQIGIVFVSKLVRLMSILFMYQVLVCCGGFGELIRKLKPKNSISNDDSFEGE